MFGRTYPRRTPPHSSPHHPRRPRRPPRWNAATAAAAARILDVVVTPPFPLGWTANGWLGLGSGPYGTTGQLAGRAWQLMRAMYGSASHDGLDGLDNGLCVARCMAWCCTMENFMNRYVNGDGRKRIFQKPKSLGKYGMVLVVTRLIEPLGLKLQLEKKQYGTNTQGPGLMLTRKKGERICWKESKNWTCMRRNRY